MESRIDALSFAAIAVRVRRLPDDYAQISEESMVCLIVRRHWRKVTCLLPFLLSYNVLAQSINCADFDVDVSGVPKDTHLYSSGEPIYIDAHPPTGKRVVQIDITTPAGARSYGTKETGLPPLSAISSDALARKVKLKFATPASGEIFDVPLTQGRLNGITIVVKDEDGLCGTARIGITVGSVSTFAVLVGVNSTLAAAKPLAYARQDAEEIADHLVRELQTPMSNVYVLTDDRNKVMRDIENKKYMIDPDNVEDILNPDTITTALKRVGAASDSGAEIYFYFSGHEYATDSALPTHAGDASEHFYLALPQSTTSDGDSFFRLRDLASKLATLQHLRIHVLVIIDACYSGNDVAKYRDAADLDNTGSKDAANPYSGEAEKPPFLIDAYIASTSANLKSWEFDDLGHGAFTYQLLDAARHAGGSLSLKRAYDAAKPATESTVRDHTGGKGKQIPDAQWRDWAEEQAMWQK